MKTVEFQTIEAGETFLSVSGEFVKVNENGAKRTEAQWADSEKFWRFSPISKIWTD